MVKGHFCLGKGGDSVTNNSSAIWGAKAFIPKVYLEILKSTGAGQSVLARFLIEFPFIHSRHFFHLFQFIYSIFFFQFIPFLSLF